MDGCHHHYFLIVLLNAILGFVQEFRTERALETLRQMTTPPLPSAEMETSQTVFPLRNWYGVTSSGWKPATVFPADAALLTASGIAANESILTGEIGCQIPQKLLEQEPTRTTPSTREMPVCARNCHPARLCHCLRHRNGHENADGTDFRLAARCHSFSNTAAKTSCRTGKSRCIALHCRVYSGLFRRGFPGRTDF